MRSLLAASLWLFAASAYGQALDRFTLGAGAFSNRLNVEGHIDGSAEVEGSTRDFDEQLGFTTRRQIELWELGWRPAARHQFDLRYYRDSRTRSTELRDELRFDDQVFPIQLDLRGRAGFRVIEATYTGWFRDTTATPIGLQFGIMRLEGELGLSGRVLVEDVGETEGSASVSDHLYAPLLGVAVRHAFNERWRCYGEARVIRLNINGIDGDAWSGRIGAEYFPTEHVGIALQYGGANIHAEKRKGGFAGELEVGFRGPQLLLRLRY